MKKLKRVIKEIKEERKLQRKKWPAGKSGNYDERPFEEWLILASEYMKEALSEYTHKPGKKAAREKLLKVANLALWGLQSEKSTD